MSTRKAVFAERLKNVLLVVLVLSTILLLYFLWNDDAGAAFRVPNADIEAIPVREVLFPERIVANFGAENYTLPADTAALWYGVEDGGAPAFMPGLA